MVREATEKQPRSLSSGRCSERVSLPRSSAGGSASRRNRPRIDLSMITGRGRTWDQMVSCVRKRDECCMGISELLNKRRPPISSAGEGPVFLTASDDDVMATVVACNKWYVYRAAFVVIQLRVQNRVFWRRKRIASTFKPRRMSLVLTRAWLHWNRLKHWLGQTYQHKFAASRKSLFYCSLKEILERHLFTRRQIFAKFSAIEKTFSGRRLCRPGLRSLR